MDKDILENVSKFLKDATPEQITEMAKDMAENAPHLIQIPLDDKERIDALIKLHLAKIADSKTSTGIEYNIGYAHGLIAGAYVAGGLGDDENEHYHEQADKIYGQTRSTLKEDKQDD